MLKNLLRRRDSPALRGAVLALLPAALPLAAALHGASGPRAVELNLGPGDGPYLEGFAPTWEIGDDLFAHHWSRRAARVVLPLEARGPLSLVYRFAPPPGGGSVLASLGEVVDHYDAPDARWEERRAAIMARQRTPLSVSLRVDGPDSRDLGLRLDWLRFEIGEGGRVWLRGTAALRPAAAVALTGLLLAGAGLCLLPTLLITTTFALASAVSLLLDPWLSHRLLSGVPEVLLVLGGAGLALLRFLRGRRRISAPDVPWLMGLFVVAALLRIVPLNHPSFFHPDLRTHARIAGLVRERGFAFFGNPYLSLWAPVGEGDRVASGMWIKSLGADAVGLPYAVAFHSALAPWGFPEDAAVTAIRTAGGAFAALVPVLVFLLARALLVSESAARWSGALAVVVPSLSAELANAAVPACFGHLFDLAFLIWLVTSLRSVAETGRPGPLANWLGGSAGLAVCYLAYTSSLVVSTLLVAALAAFVWAREPGLRPATRGLVLVLTVGSAAAIALYYWAFVPATLRALGAIGSGLSGTPGPAAVRTFGSVWPALLAWAAPVGGVLAFLGLAQRLRRPGIPRAFFSAVLATLAVVGLARLAAPQVFGWVHDALFAGPIFCLGLGVALSEIQVRGRAARGLAIALFTGLVLGGLVQYARLLAAQAGRAL